MGTTVGWVWVVAPAALVVFDGPACPAAGAGGRDGAVGAAREGPAMLVDTGIETGGGL